MGIDKNAVFLLTSADGGEKSLRYRLCRGLSRGTALPPHLCPCVDQLDGRINAGGEEAGIVDRGSADGIDLALLRIPCDVICD